MLYLIVFRHSYGNWGSGTRTSGDQALLVCVTITQGALVALPVGRCKT